MKKESELQNQLKAVRTRLGLSQQELATTAGVARQTIGGIEAGTYALSLTVALRLAKALGCTIEELFWLESDLPTVEAVPLASIPQSSTVRVALAQVENRWIAAPLIGEQAFRQEMVPADGIGTWNKATGRLSVQLLDTPEVLSQTIFLAGCTPALSLWARSAERWHPGLRVPWIHANSTVALDRLARGEVHVAGVHLFDPKTGEENIPFVRHAMRGIPTVLVTLGVWEEGLLLPPGNPKNIQRCSDLAQAGITLVNREKGAGVRLLLDFLLEEEGVDPATIVGYDRTVAGHLEVAAEIHQGRADAGISTAAIAAAYGLSFVPLRSTRYDLAIRKTSLDHVPMQQLLSTLHHRWVRSQLAVLGGYDTSRTGEIIDLG